MPWRLIQFIAFFVVFLLFIMFNLENTCDINFGFTVIRDAPVYLTAFFSFIVGMICSALFILVFKPRARPGKGAQDKGKGRKKPGKPKDEPHADSGLYGID